MQLEGSCRCGAVSFSVESHTPHPYQLCYCSICRKTAGGGGYAINLMGDASTLKVTGRESLGVYQAEIADEDGRCKRSEAQRHFCTRCASALWLFGPALERARPSLRVRYRFGPAGSAEPGAFDAAL